MSDNGMQDFSDSPQQGEWGEDSNGNTADVGNAALNVLDHQKLINSPGSMAMSMVMGQSTYRGAFNNMKADLTGSNLPEGQRGSLRDRAGTLGNKLKVDWGAVNDKTGQLASDKNRVKGDYEKFLSKAKGTVGIDPLKWLVGTLVDFLVQTFQPLEDILGVVTGNEARMNVSANMWQEVGNAMPPIADHMLTVVEGELAQWEGEAGSAARARVMELGLMMDVMGHLAGGMEFVLHMMAGLAKALRTFVQKLITDGVVWVIKTIAPQIAASIATLGAAAPVCIAMTVAKIAGLVLDAIQMVQGAMQMFQDFGALLNLVQDVFSILQPFVAELVQVPKPSLPI
ncbi:hypothetical protein O1R50_25690 [Glycomyces luteolus]|uniref:Uncharacterized protein n=1 Tax=Glycomyces luteolus TaxID=2670330 RepID=A0A9X3PFZ1_9ACTN|nr:hypothetical protein [Glycomyces luteolus]MDA1363032.1 hypothetical protein [Glycomyces luteolus]